MKRKSGRKVRKGKDMRTVIFAQYLNRRHDAKALAKYNEAQSQVCVCLYKIRKKQKAVSYRGD